MREGPGGELLGRKLAMWVLAGGALLVSSAGIAGAQGVSQEQYADRGAEVPAESIPSLEGRVAEHDLALEARIRDISEVGEDLRETQARMDGAASRAGELREQARELEQKLAAQRKSYKQSKASYEERARAAYQGRNLEGLGALIDEWLGSGRGATGGQLAGVARVLVAGRQDLEAYEDSRETLEGMVRQISQKEKDYQAAIQEQRASAEELRSREADLDASIAELRSDRNRTGSGGTGTCSPRSGRSSPTTGRTWAPPALAPWARCSSCPPPGPRPGWTATATVTPTSWTPKTPYRPPPATSRREGRPATGTPPSTPTTTPTGT